MIDINKMRRLALDGDLAAMQEIILRLEAAESECLEQARLNGMGGEREAALMAKLEAAEKERDALRAKVAEMERQEPVGKFVQHPSNGLWEQDGYGDNPDARPLYALPGAQPAPRVPDDGFKRGVECAVACVARKAELYSIRFGDDDARRHILSVLVDELCGLFKVQPAPSVPSGLHPLETVRFWADAYTHPGDDNFRGHGMAAALLREYAELRAALAAAPGAKP